MWSTALQHGFVLEPDGLTCTADILPAFGTLPIVPTVIVDVHDLFVLLANWTLDTFTDFTGDHTTDVNDLFYLLARWGTCEAPLGFVPESVEDCIDMFGLGEENRDKLNACLEAVELMEGQ